MDYKGNNERHENMLFVVLDKYRQVRLGASMKVGKISETVLKRSVFKQIRHRREEVLVRPSVGEDCSVLEFEEDEVMVLSTDPITGTIEDIGTFAVHVTANDIASSGAEFVGIMLTILLPPPFEEKKLKELIKEIEEECQALNVEIIGGHTEITRAVNQPILTVTGVGKIKKEDLVTTKGVTPGQEVVLTKWIGLEGTAIIAKAKERELQSKYTQEFIDQGKDFLTYISVVPEAKIAKELGVSSMHDITEGGVFGALWEVAAASNVGIEVDLAKIPIRQETVEVCEFFDLNPYMLMSSGSLLIVTDHANHLVEVFNRHNIAATVIGRITEGKERIVINEDEKRYLEPPKSDELYKVV